MKIVSQSIFEIELNQCPVIVLLEMHHQMIENADLVRRSETVKALNELRTLGNG